MRNRFDRWLLRKFTVEHHIYTLSDPGPPPFKLKRKEIPDQANTKYRFHFMTRDERVADAFIKYLKEEQMNFNTQLMKRKGLLARFVNPEGRSFTFTMIARVFGIAIAAGVGYVGYLAIYENIFDDEIQAVIDFINGSPTEDMKKLERDQPELP